MLLAKFIDGERPAADCAGERPSLAELCVGSTSGLQVEKMNGNYLNIQAYDQQSWITFTATGIDLYCLAARLLKANTADYVLLLFLIYWYF